MYHRISTKLAGAIAVATLLCGAANAADWRGWNIHTDGYPNTVGMDNFAELLAAKTGGEITLQMFHGGTLGSQPDAIEQVRLGGLEIGNFNLGPIGPIAAEANVVSLPFIFKDVPHMFRVLDGEYITCPWHQWRYDLCSGRRIDLASPRSGPDARRLVCCEVSLSERGTLLLRLSAPDASAGPR